MSARGKLRIIDDHGVVAHYCPACRRHHIIIIDKSKALWWDFDGNYDNPTLYPSIKIEEHSGDICHYFIAGGKIEYLTDCTHELAGKVVDMTDAK